MSFAKNFYGLDVLPPNRQDACGIILSGKRFSGKSSIAEAIRRLTHCEVVDVDGTYPASFAFALKQDYAQINDVPLADLFNQATKAAHVEGLIALAKRRKAENGLRFYCERLQSDIKAQGLGWVNDDTRYWYELGCLLEIGGMGFRIEASLETRIWRGLVVSSAEEDESETGLDDHPYWGQHPYHVYWNDEDDLENVDWIARQIILSAGWTTREGKSGV